MFLSAAIDSGIGLTAGKKLCGKAIAQSDDTYLTTVNLKQKFIQIKKFLSIKEQPRLQTEQIEPLKNAINKLQEDLTNQKIIVTVISEENQKIKKQFEQLDPIFQFLDKFDEIGGYEYFLDLLNRWKQVESEQTQLVKTKFSYNLENKDTNKRITGTEPFTNIPKELLNNLNNIIDRTAKENEKNREIIGKVIKIDDKKEA
jgi:hypothetical protein